MTATTTRYSPRVCGTCYYWLAPTDSDGEDRRGRCRRSPPVVVVLRTTKGRDQAVTTWPRLAADDWCGKHSLRPDLAEAERQEDDRRQRAERAETERQRAERAEAERQRAESSWRPA